MLSAFEKSLKIRALKEGIGALMELFCRTKSLLV